MEQLDKVISSYLSAENTDYAIMVNGEWGCGKTYYFNHEFKTLVGKTIAPASSITIKTQKARKSLSEDNKSETKDRYFKPAFVSLYGLSSAEDFYQRVFYGINGWADSGFIRLIGVGISKAASFFNIETKKEDSKAITYIDTNRVLVFDDLERICEDKIPVKEVLGLINSYSEHNKRKVIIVCNENAFIGEDTSAELMEAYKKYKEKSVRYTYTYEANIGEVYDYFIDKCIDADYKNYLKDNKKRLLDVFTVGGKKNLRTLLFFLDSFEQIYNETKCDPYASEVQQHLMITSLLYTMEYKMGASVEELDELNPARYQLDTTLLGIRTDEETQNNEKDYASDFREKYSNYLPYFTNSDIVLSYIVNGYLNKEELKKLINELSAQYNRQKITPQGKAYYRLRNYAMLEDKDVKPLINKILEYVYDDKYNIYDLLYVYADLLKCSHWKFSGFKMTKRITEQIKDSIKRQSFTHIYFPTFEFKIPMWDNSDGETDEYKLYKAMKDFACKVNYDAKLRVSNMNGQAFMKAAVDGNVKLLTTYRQNKDIVISTLDLDWKKICHLLEKGSNPIACELCNCITFLTSMGRLQPDDMDRIKNEFKPWLDKYDADKDKRVRAMYISEMKQHINQVIR